MTDTWQHLCAGDLVEVRSKTEILATLDADGRLDGMPFMPEMLQYCGRRFRIHKRAHKTCDFVTNTGSRRLPGTVHLEDVRCDGSAHAGCQAQCLIFWKEAWLKPADILTDLSTTHEEPVGRGQFHSERGGGCGEEELWNRTRAPRVDVGSEEIFVCQATLLPRFTEPLSPWDVRQYIEDYQSGNTGSLWWMIPRFLYRAYDNLINLGIGWGPVLRWFYDRFQSLLGGLPYPARHGTIPIGSTTPSEIINLRPGELVRVKDLRTILGTLDESSKNRGMAFSAEMAPYCGKTLRVHSRVERIIDEKSGRLIRMKNPCIVLEGGVCQARFNRGMIFCPRATYAYWREIWLERAP